MALLIILLLVSAAKTEFVAGLVAKFKFGLAPTLKLKPCELPVAGLLEDAPPN